MLMLLGTTRVCWVWSRASAFLVSVILPAMLREGANG